MASVEEELCIFLLMLCSLMKVHQQVRFLIPGYSQHDFLLKRKDNSYMRLYRVSYLPFLLKVYTESALCRQLFTFEKLNTY